MKEMELPEAYEPWDQHYSRKTEGLFRGMACTMNMHQERLVQASGMRAAKARMILGRSNLRRVLVKADQLQGSV